MQRPCNPKRRRNSQLAPKRVIKLPYMKQSIDRKPEAFRKMRAAERVTRIAKRERKAHAQESIVFSHLNFSSEG